VSAPLGTADVGGVRLAVRPGTWDHAIAKEVILQDCYRVRDWTPENPVTILDVGGHIGSFSKWMATRLPNARIFTFEMDEANGVVCEKNLGGLPNVTLVKAALGPRSGDVVRGPVHSDNTGGGHVEWSAKEGARVPAFGIADFLADRSIDYIDCLKLDCEGSEFAIVDAMVKFPGGLRKWVGCLRAELHALQGTERYDRILAQLRDAFPFVEVAPTQSPHQHYLFAWR
jgi:FkbM family methyltransferase